jgi:hypothetical protein
LASRISHFRGTGGTFDWDYGPVACERLAIDNPLMAISNAANFEIFAEDAADQAQFVPETDTNSAFEYASAFIGWLAALTPQLV